MNKKVPILPRVLKNSNPLWDNLNKCIKCKDFPCCIFCEVDKPKIVDRLPSCYTISNRLYGISGFYKIWKPCQFSNLGVGISLKYLRHFCLHNFDLISCQVSRSGSTPDYKAVEITRQHYQVFPTSLPDENDHYQAPSG